jgi:DUF4097 and DUF4098 domain-containing protein YvlB
MGSPAPVPDYRHRHPRSFAGPIVLIVIGVVFLLSTMGILRWENLGYWFAHYWPLLLILWGVIKLVEYWEAQRSGSRPAGIGAGGVLLLVMLVIFGLMATQATRINWDEFRDQMHINNSDFPFFGHTYAYDDQLNQDFPTGATLHIVDNRGAVNVTASQDNQIHATIHKRINAERQEDADKWNTGTKPQITVSGNMVSLNANTQGAGDHWVATDMDVSIPRKASVVISNRNGDVSLLGRDGDADITNDHGDVAVTDVNGKVQLNLDHSSARLSQISSDVTIQGRADDVSLQDVKGSVTLNGDFMESLKLSNIARPVSFKSPRTNINLMKLGGDLELDSGDLTADHLTGPVRIDTRSKDIELNSVSGDLRLQDENGALEIHMAKMGSVQVTNTNGDVQIYVPDRAAFQLDARARGGEIQSDFSGLNINNGDELATANGSVGGGGPRMVINNEHGSIEINKGSAVAEAPASSPVATDN